MMNRNLSVIIFILAFCLSCKKDPPYSDFIGTWELVSANGKASTGGLPGSHSWYKSKTISTSDNIISINIYNYDLYLNIIDYTWEGDSIRTSNDYEFTVKMEIYSNRMLQIKEVYTRLSDDSIFSGSIHSYWDTSSELLLYSYLIKFSFIEPDPIGFRSFIFYKIDSPVIMDEFNENGTIKITADVEHKPNGTGLTYIFKKVN